jgi:hypothetical protein
MLTLLIKCRSIDLETTQNNLINEFNSKILKTGKIPNYFFLHKFIQFPERNTKNFLIQGNAISFSITLSLYLRV